MIVSVRFVLAALPASLAAAPPPCEYGEAIKYTAEATSVFVKPCSVSDATQRWAGDTLRQSGTYSTLTNAGSLEGACLGTSTQDPVSMDNGCDTQFFYNHSNRSIAVVESTGKLRPRWRNQHASHWQPSEAVGSCLDVNHGHGPDVQFYACHDGTSGDLQHQQFMYEPESGQLRNAGNTSLCLALNRTKILPYITPPCTWPNRPAAGLPFEQSTILRGITVLENATAIKNYGADTWYPAEDRHGNLYSGFDDGAVDGVSVGSACTRVRSKCASGKFGFKTGSAVVRGDSWRNLSVQATGGAIFEDGYPMQGRYTCANAVANSTWWVGSYGLAVGDASCEAGTGVLQFCEMGPFVGFRSST